MKLAKKVIHISEVKDRKSHTGYYVDIKYDLQQNPITGYTVVDMTKPDFIQQAVRNVINNAKINFPILVGKEKMSKARFINHVLSTGCYDTQEQRLP